MSNFDADILEFIAAAYLDEAEAAAEIKQFMNCLTISKITHTAVASAVYQIPESNRDTAKTIHCLYSKSYKFPVVAVEAVTEARRV